MSLSNSDVDDEDDDDVVDVVDDEDDDDPTNRNFRFEIEQLSNIASDSVRDYYHRLKPPSSFDDTAKWITDWS